MGTTAKGYPYPEATDLVGNTHLAIKALADKVNDQLTTETKAGVNTVTTSASGDATINHGMGGVPTWANAQVTTGDNRVAILTGLTATQLTFKIRQVTDGATINSTSVGLRWAAIRP